MVRESRIISDLLLREVSDTEWKNAIVQENILQKRTPASAKRNAHTVKKRLSSITSDYWGIIKSGDDELATQATLVAALESNPLLVEFFQSVLEEAYRSHVERMYFHDWTDFIESRLSRDPVLGEWTEASRKKIGQVTFRMLAQAGFIENARSMKLQRVVLRNELRSLLKKNGSDKTLACMEVAQ